MAWGTAGNIATGNLDAGTDSPSAARADLKAALDELLIVINGRNQASGIAGLDGSSKLTASQIPDEINSSGSTNLTIDPSTGKVKLEEILNLKPQTVAELNSRTDVEEGDIAFCINGDGGNMCLALCLGDVNDSAGSGWHRIAVGAAISA